MPKNGKINKMLDAYSSETIAKMAGLSIEDVEKYKKDREWFKKTEAAIAEGLDELPVYFQNAQAFIDALKHYEPVRDYGAAIRAAMIVIGQKGANVEAENEFVCFRKELGKGEWVEFYFRAYELGDAPADDENRGFYHKYIFEYCDATMGAEEMASMNMIPEYFKNYREFLFDAMRYFHVPNYEKKCLEALSELAKKEYDDDQEGDEKTYDVSLNGSETDFVRFVFRIAKMGGGVSGSDYLYCYESYEEHFPERQRIAAEIEREAEERRRARRELQVELDRLEKPETRFYPSGVFTSLNELLERFNLIAVTKGDEDDILNAWKNEKTVSFDSNYRVWTKDGHYIADLVGSDTGRMPIRREEPNKAPFAEPKVIDNQIVKPSDSAGSQLQNRETGFNNLRVFDDIDDLARRFKLEPATANDEGDIIEFLNDEIPLSVDFNGRVWTEGGVYIADVIGRGPE